MAEAFALFTCFGFITAFQIALNGKGGKMKIQSCYLCGKVYQAEWVTKQQTLLGEIYICRHCRKEADNAPMPKLLPLNDNRGR